MRVVSLLEKSLSTHIVEALCVRFAHKSQGARDEPKANKADLALRAYDQKRFAAFTVRISSPALRCAPCGRRDSNSRPSVP